MSLLRAVCLALCFAAPAMAQDDPAAAALAAKEQLQAAHAELDAASGSQDRVEALTRTVQAYEAGLQAMRNGLRRAAIRDGREEQDPYANLPEFDDSFFGDEEFED